MVTKDDPWGDRKELVLSIQALLGTGEGPAAITLSVGHLRKLVSILTIAGLGPLMGLETES
jgi:hypothetical protein